MKVAAKILTTGFILIAGIAYAETMATDPTVIARQDLMKSFGGAAKTLGEMAGGKVAYDAVAAEAAKAILAAAITEIPTKFETNASDPGSKAKPEIWTSWDDFAIKAKALGDAAAMLDTGSVESIGAGMAAVGGACKACHTMYRM